MNQIMPVGKGVLIAVEHRITAEVLERLSETWKERFPDVPVFIISEAQIVERGETTLFEFTGDVSPQFAAEFQRWWEGVSGATEG